MGESGSWPSEIGENQIFLAISEECIVGAEKMLRIYYIQLSTRNLLFSCTTSYTKSLLRYGKCSFLNHVMAMINAWPNIYRTIAGP